MDHSPETLRAASNFAHSVEGAILLLAATIATLQALGIGGGEKRDLLWPGLILCSAGFLGGYLILHHGWSLAGEVFHYLVRDPQQRQHLLISLFALIAGISETAAVFVKRKRPTLSRLLSFGFPIAAVCIAAVFLSHQQHGTLQATVQAQRVHELLAVVFLSMAALRIISLQRPASLKYRLSWPIALASAGVLLLTYREPPGSYEPANSHLHSSQESRN
ncbi:MAG: hypothetical protein M3P00_08465 [Gemmatimonadota bacterium]|nr:hypothetical protein [Gemmatimonadota bacterium]